MKKVSFIGKLIIVIGVLNLFRKVEGFNGFGGYQDNAWEILLISLILFTIGFFMFWKSKNILRNE
jgi:hypothetical protein